ncbi:unnamed protein product [Caenorhabditis nigoni]
MVLTTKDIQTSVILTIENPKYDADSEYSKSFDLEYQDTQEDTESGKVVPLQHVNRYVNFPQEFRPRILSSEIPLPMKTT